ncbi:sugar kinase [Pseudomonas donghuensis]|uniref:sugar kinase n=1 Tax=Pseudomonas donghuensis TaxID=1163398 RepID=UPI00029A41CB|nr:sugar kinase [Pseudomonas donghuensis]
MAMESPALLLTDLNKALRRLRGACTDLGNEEIDEKLLEVMRRLLLAEVLGNTWIVVMGGSQGAGKTTLMASIYELRGDGPRWLQSNEGRGEKMPVLILEVEGLERAQGYVRRLVPDAASQGYRLDDFEVDIPQFQRAICDPNAEDLLPILKVPRRYFKRDNQAWLLLPGYEKQERDNRAWQELMRQAMIAAGGCIIVTDETRLANQQQLEIVRDMLENELKGCKPYIVVSKTEAHRNDPKRQADLRSTAQATFQVAPELAERNIILSGTDDAEYMEQWMPHLRRAIDDLNFTGESDRHFQMSHLSEIVGKDLTRVLNAIRSKARLYFTSDKASGVDGAEVLEEVLGRFDEAAAELRSQHNQLVSKLAGEAFTKASDSMNRRLIADHEGFGNWLSNAFDTTSQTRMKMQDLVQGSWREAASAFFHNYSQGVSSLTASKLERLPEEKSGEGSGVRLPQAKSQNLIQMGFVHASGQPVRFEKLNPEAVSDISILLGNGRREAWQANQDVSKQVGASAELIPAMSLEYTRLIFAVPEVVGVKQDFVPIDSTSGANAVSASVDNLRTGVELGKTAIRSLATVLAVDVVSDGDSDILGALFGKTAGADAEDAGDAGDSGSSGSETKLPMPLTLHPAAVAATAVVAAAYLTGVAVTRIRSIEKAASAQARVMLGTVHDHHVENLRTSFDETMAVARARVCTRLRARYRMDELLMRKDRLAKAIADVTSITSDLRYELDSSASGLQLFIADRGV